MGGGGGLVAGTDVGGGLVGWIGGADLFVG